jgi:hypothetical protein
MDDQGRSLKKGMFGYNLQEVKMPTLEISEGYVFSEDKARRRPTGRCTPMCSRGSRKALRLEQMRKWEAVRGEF